MRRKLTGRTNLVPFSFFDLFLNALTEDGRETSHQQLKRSRINKHQVYKYWGDFFCAENGDLVALLYFHYACWYGKPNWYNISVLTFISVLELHTSMGNHYWYNIRVLSVFVGLHTGIENHYWCNISIFSVFLLVYQRNKKICSLFTNPLCYNNFI